MSKKKMIIKEFPSKLVEGALCYTFSGEDYDAVPLVQLIEHSIMRSQQPSFCAWKQDSMPENRVTLTVRDANVKEAIRDCIQNLKGCVDTISVNPYSFQFQSS